MEGLLRIAVDDGRGSLVQWQMQQWELPAQVKVSSGILLFRLGGWNQVIHWANELTQVAAAFKTPW
jgi:hypothetical protein